MPKIKDIPKIERPREKLEKYGPEKLSDSELLAIILRTGTKNVNVLKLSDRVLKKFKKEKMTDIALDDLTDISGLGLAKASQVIACFELGKRFLQNKKANLILSPHNVWENCKDIRDSKKEHFVVFYLDARSQEIKREIVSIGTLNASLIHPREVFESAIKHSAAQIIIAHNHPSGNCEPSVEDIAITERLQTAGSILGIEVIDHVIVTKDAFLSLKATKKGQN